MMPSIFSPSRSFSYPYFCGFCGGYVCTRYFISYIVAYYCCIIFRYYYINWSTLSAARTRANVGCTLPNTEYRIPNVGIYANDQRRRWTALLRTVRLDICMRNVIITSLYSSTVYIIIMEEQCVLQEIIKWVRERLIGKGLSTSCPFILFGSAILASAHDVYCWFYFYFFFLN